MFLDSPMPNLHKPLLSNDSNDLYFLMIIMIVWFSLVKHDFIAGLRNMLKGKPLVSRPETEKVRFSVSEAAVASTQRHCARGASTRTIVAKMHNFTGQTRGKQTPPVIHKLQGINSRRAMLIQGRASESDFLSGLPLLMMTIGETCLGFRV